MIAPGVESELHLWSHLAQIVVSSIPLGETLSNCRATALEARVVRGSIGIDAVWSTLGVTRSKSPQFAIFARDSTMLCREVGHSLQRFRRVNTLFCPRCDDRFCLQRILSSMRRLLRLHINIQIPPNSILLRMPLVILHPGMPNIRRQRMSTYHPRRIGFDQATHVAIEHIARRRIG